MRLLFWFFVASVSGSTPIVGQESRFAQVLDDLLNLAPDPQHMATVSNLVIRRDTATFTFHRGTFYLTSEVGGEVVGAYFVGEGRAQYTPPLEIERNQLDLFFEEPQLDVPFKTMLLLFTDSTLTELQHQLSFAPGEQNSVRDGRREIEEALKYLTGGEKDRFDPTIIAAILNKPNPGLFYAHFAERRGDPLAFYLDPYDEESVILMKRGRGRVRGDVYEVVTQHATGAGLPTAETPPPYIVRLANYVVDASFQSNLDFAAKVEVDVIPLQENVQWTWLSLFWDLGIKSIQWKNGTPVTYHRPKESSTLWIDLSAFPGDSMSTLVLEYEGDIVEWNDVFKPYRRVTDRNRAMLIGVRSSIGWYPQHNPWERAHFDLTFHTPSIYKFVTIGERTENVTEGGVTTSKWTAGPTRNAGFNLGEFEEHQIRDPRIPPVTLQIAEKFHRAIWETEINGITYAINQQNDRVGAVNADLANALSFFTSFFGPAPVQRFWATEIPGGHGEAFSGLVHLSWNTFLQTREEGHDEAFRAHEVAHQWWGIAVEPTSYRDRWISEGFSDFAGLWYLHTIRQDSDQYFKILKESGDRIRDAREKSGPIWLGHRVGRYEHPEFYGRIIYEKGAWVLHMLRNLFINLKTMDETPFNAMMKDFYTRHAGGTASTADFQAVVEEHSGLDMTWFFDQWVYGTDIPTYTFAHKVNETPDGQFQISIRVRQENVPPGFQMVVPLRLDFGFEGATMMRMVINQPVIEVELPPVPIKPLIVELNPLQSVLAEVKTEGW